MGEEFCPSGVRGRFTPMPDGIMKCRHLGAAEKIVWARLARYANGKPYCYPSLTTLAHEVGRSRDSVSKSINKLIEKGLLRREGMPGKATRYHYLASPHLSGECADTYPKTRSGGVRNFGHEDRIEEQEEEAKTMADTPKSHPHAPSPMRDNLRTLEDYKRATLAD